MDEMELGKYLHKQQDQILTLQVLLQSLVDELIETNVLSEDALDARTKEKVLLIKKELDDLKKKSPIMPFNFGGPMGEA